MKTLISAAGVAFGLALGLSLTYALYANEAARLVFMFIFGAVLIGSTVLLTALAINRQWTKSLPDHRVTHHHRYQIPTSQPTNYPTTQSPNHQPYDLLPPPPSGYEPWPFNGHSNHANVDADIDDQIVA